MKKHYLALITGALLILVALAGCLPTTTPAEGQQGGLSQNIGLIVVLVLVILMFYFLMIRPMRQREKKRDEMVKELQKGDTVITAGGILGQIDSIAENTIVIKVESGATIRLTKSSVLGKVEKTGVT